MSLASSLILKMRWGGLSWIMVIRVEPKWDIGVPEVACSKHRRELPQRNTPLNSASFVGRKLFTGSRLSAHL